MFLYRTALTEVSVLLDVLNVAKEKKYMVLDPVTQDPPDPRNGVHLLAKKRVCLIHDTFLLSKLFNIAQLM